MHIDLNSCFASVEQQANPLLRERPVAVVHSDAPYGCILAPSVEAKLWGVKTGMTLQEGKTLCPWIIARVADPNKYRQIHSQFARLLDDYSDHVISKSIDEFVLTLPMIPASKGSDLKGRAQPRPDDQRGRSDPQGNHEKVLTGIAQEIKSRIKTEIGDYLRVSIGISTNQILAKLASGLHKPDGFDIIDSNNFMDIYNTIELQDFCGINTRNEARLNRVGIFTATQFYSSDLQTLKSAFESVLGRYWYTRLRGYELDDVAFPRRSFGQSYVLPHPMEVGEWRPILSKLVSKAARRLRRSGFGATGVHLYLRFGDHTSWHTSHNTANNLSSDAELLSAALSLHQSACPPKLKQKKVKKIAVSYFGLKSDNGQQSCLVDLKKQKSLLDSLDSLNDKWGENSVIYGSMLGSQDHVHDAIAFGK